MRAASPERTEARALGGVRPQRGLHLAAAAACLAVVLAGAVAVAGRADVGAAPAGLSAGLAPFYKAAAAAYRVHWLLLAAIHERETQFSALEPPGVRSGWNGCGAAGPMQFGIVGVPPARISACRA